MKKCRKMFFSPCHKRGTKKKIWVPVRNCTSDLWIPCSDAPPPSHSDSMVSKAIMKFKTWCFWHCRSYQYAGRMSNINFVMGPAHHRVSAAQRQSTGTWNTHRSQNPLFVPCSRQRLKNIVLHVYAFSSFTRVKMNML